ncbi:MAG: ATP-binding protein [Bacteroidales bacterium]|nr:ATP-binding protein [Bacteroidales bacterium]
MITRIQKDSILRTLSRGKAVLIMGPRQVGKSTLTRQIFADRDDDVLWLNGDDGDTRDFFLNFTATKMRQALGSKSILVIDEAQRLVNPGLCLKVIADQLPDVQLVATGSSSFELSKGINESMAGRKRELQLLPLSFREMVDYHGLIEETRMLDQRLVMGYYPEVVMDPDDARATLRELANSYLYKDILALDAVNKSDKLDRLVQALSYQIGGQVSFNEVGQLVGLDPKTVERYIDILEKTFVIFRLTSFSRNHRNELKFSRKIYFWDNGIRNAVIGNYTPLDMRSPEEKGALWENFIIAERLKRHAYDGFYGHTWFWRTTQQKEVDLIEEIDGQLRAFEFKFNPKKKVTEPLSFRNAYPDAPFQVISPTQITDFLL